MTNKEAIRQLRATISVFNEWKCEEAMQIAIKAIKKQIPKKPIIRVYENDDWNDYWKCPSCGEIRSRFNDGEELNYCPNCGQAIDWGE